MNKPENRKLTGLNFRTIQDHNQVKNHNEQETGRTTRLGSLESKRRDKKNMGFNVLVLPKILL